LDAYVASSVVPYSACFHDPATGAATDPASPGATLRVTPFGGTASFSTLPAPTQLNSATGWYGGEYTVPAGPVKGTYEIRLFGTVGGVVQSAVVARFQVGVDDGYRPDEVLSLLLAHALGEVSEGAGGAFTFKDPSGAATRATGTKSGSGRSGLTLTPAG
jgi:hypothetical protein